MPHELVRAPGHSRKRSLGHLVVAWIEYFCIHGPGDIQGRPLDPTLPDAIPLSDELAQLTVDCYALDANGRRLYDSVFFSRPKGADKSGQGSRIGLAEALGPVRFAGWAKGGEVYEQGDFRYEYQPGEPMGRRVTYPYIRILATEEGQTGNVYDSMYYNLKEGRLREFFFARQGDVGLTRVFLPGNGEIVPSTASSSSKEGGKETWTSFDETHLYLRPDLHRMYEVVRRNMAKRRDAEPWSFESSTMYEPGRGSVAERSHQLAQDIRDGKIARPRFLFDHRQAPQNIDMDDDDALRAGLREAYGDAASYMGIDRIVEEIRDPRNDPADSKRYFLNMAVASSGRAFDVEAWIASTKHESPPASGLITLGFDGSLTDDNTALVATHVESGYQWPLGIWQPAEEVDEWRFEVDAVVDEAFRRYQVWRMYADPSKWETELSRWSGRYGAEKVIAWPTIQTRRMSLALKAYAGAISAGQVPHVQDPVFQQHIANAYRVPMRFRDDDDKPLWLISKDKPISARKIDAAMAGCLSWAARLDAVAAGAQETKGWVVR